MKHTHRRNVAGSSLAEIMSLTIIIVCSILLIIPFVLKQDDTQSETLILGYERTARKAAKDALDVGADSLGMNISNKEQVAFVVDSKGKRIYALEERETLSGLHQRLKKHKIEPIEKYGVELTMTSDDPWQTRVIDTCGKEILSFHHYDTGEIMKTGKTFDLKEYIICVSARKAEDGSYQYYQWWQNASGSDLMKN